MRTKRYRVTLTAPEREHLESLLRGGTHAARTLQHARILLLADAPADQSGRFDAEIAATAGVSADTVERVRRRFVEEGLEAALVPHPSTAPHLTKLDGRGEARLIAEVCGLRSEVCGPPPAGQARWTLRLVAQRLVELGIVEAISYETVRRTLKKTC